MCASHSLITYEPTWRPGFRKEHVGPPDKASHDSLQNLQGLRPLGGLITIESALPFFLLFCELFTRLGWPVNQVLRPVILGE